MTLLRYCTSVTYGGKESIPLNVVFTCFLLNNPVYCVCYGPPVQRAKSMATAWPLCHRITFAKALCAHTLGLSCPNLAEHNSHFNYTFSGNGSTAPLCTYLTQLPISINVAQCDTHVYDLLWVGISIPLRFVVLRYGYIHAVVL